MIKTDMLDTEHKLECITKWGKDKVKKSKVKLIVTLVVLMTLSGVLGLIYDQVYGGNFYEQR